MCYAFLPCFSHFISSLKLVCVCDSVRFSFCTSSLGSDMNTDEKQTFNAKLITEVRKHEFLWNIRDKKYKATHSKEPTWRCIAEHLGSTGEQEFIGEQELANKKTTVCLHPAKQTEKEEHNLSKFSNVCIAVAE